MKLLVKRFEFGTNYTIGKMYVNDAALPTCFTLEDRVREIPDVSVWQWKIPKETAIPVGIYKVVIDHSDHFNRELPHILDVPGFTGVRIHQGNSDKDTEGCILVGKYWPGGDWISNSALAYVEVAYEIKQALDRGEEVTIEVQ